MHNVGILYQLQIYVNIMINLLMRSSINRNFNSFFIAHKYDKIQNNE